MFRLRFQAKRLSGGFLAVNKGQLATLPIRIIAATDSVGRARHDEIIDLAERLSTLHLRLSDTHSSATLRSLPRQLAAAEQRMDQLVYQLYDLTAAEIEVVERSVYQLSSVS